MSFSEYDIRQIALMKELISSFKLKKIPIEVLINNLRALLDILETKDTSWKEKFYDHWFTLEQVYAVSLDENESIEKYDKYIKESIEGLDNLLE